MCCKTFHQEEVPGTEIEDLNFSQSGSLITVPVVIYEDESDDEDDLIDDGEKDIQTAHDRTLQVKTTNS